MKLDLEATIVAVGSGLAPAQRGVVRMSGKHCRDILEQVTVCPDEARRFAKQAWLASRGPRQIRLPVQLGLAGRTIEADCYFWPDSRSYTGELSAEIHLLGSLPIIESLVEYCCQCGARLAERGEFTLRSFLAGKLDLAQAEAVLGVIEAESDSDLQWALSQLSGNISRPVRELRNKLVELTAHVEAGMDFVEEDIEFIAASDLTRDLAVIQSQLQEIEERMVSRGTRTRVPQVVLVGPPNAGKSSLFNAITQTERVIVSSEAGTTRDAVSQRTRIGDTEMDLTDTAGAEDIVGESARAQGQRVLARALSDADLVLLCVPPELSVEQALEPVDRLENKSHLVLGTKSDLSRTPQSQFDAQVSIRDAKSIASLEKVISARLMTLERETRSETLHLTMARCVSSISDATQALRRGQELIGNPIGEELVVVELRHAIESLSSMIGEVHTEDILGEIFSRFCIGK